MTLQEIDRIEDAIDLIIQTVTEIDPWAVEIAVEAMQKQIPKKPKMPIDAYWVCPVCGKKVEYPYEHCARCSQAIDWGNE